MARYPLDILTPAEHPEHDPTQLSYWPDRWTYEDEPDYLPLRCVPR